MKNKKNKEMNLDKIKDILISFGINEDIFCHASKMDLNIVKLFYEKLVCNYSLKNIDEVTRNLLGVYGNYIATKYYKNLYSNVENEVPIIYNNKEITKADISFVDENNKVFYVEVKAAKQIIDNIRNYVDLDLPLNNCYLDKDNEIMKYKMIGKKLIEQVKKLSKNNNNIIVAVFEGCYIDSIIRQKLSELNARIDVINVNIERLEEDIKRRLILARNNILESKNIDFKGINLKSKRTII